MNAVMNVMMTIWQSKIMTLGVVCEILAVIAAALSAPVIPTPEWLPYAALLMATIGAAIVAGKVAWDYHSRGLNATQRQDVQDILASAGLSGRQWEEIRGILANDNLNEAQKEEVAEAIRLNGLTERQKSELEAAIKDVHIYHTVLAQKAMVEALSYVWKVGPGFVTGHGHIVVIDRTSTGQFDIQRVESPRLKDGCERRHEDEPTPDINTLEIAKSLLQPTGSPAVLWIHPGNGKLCYTNLYNQLLLGRGLVFNRYDCVPEWRASAPGDDVLTRDESHKWTWVQRS